MARLAAFLVFSIPLLGCARYEFRDAGRTTVGLVRLGWRLDRWTGEVCQFTASVEVSKTGCAK